VVVNKKKRKTTGKYAGFFGKYYALKLKNKPSFSAVFLAEISYIYLSNKHL